jgi:Xaa-Pro dipeptidase
LEAIVALSRCGGTHDRVADALWLSGLATTQPFVPDLPGHWRAAGHVAVVVPVGGGATTAIVDSEHLQTEPVAERVVVSDDVIAASVDGLAAELSARDPGRVGCSGATRCPRSGGTR